MTTTDELREAVARQLCETAGHVWPDRIAANYWRKEADRIIRMVVDACADHFDQRAKDLPLGHESRSRGASSYNWLTHFARELRALAPKEPAP